MSNEIAPDFKHGENFKIGEFCHIHEGVVVGDNVQIRSHVELRKNTIIGDNCYIDSGVKTSGDCKIGNDVVLRYDTIIARDVIIEDGVFMAPQCMTEYSDYKREKQAGTIIGSHVFIGTNVTLAANIKICPGSVIARKSDINSDITEPAIYGSKNGKVVKIRDVDEDHWDDKTLDRPRGQPCKECGRMLTERNSNCPVSTSCLDCWREGGCTETVCGKSFCVDCKKYYKTTDANCPDCGLIFKTDFTEPGDEEHTKKMLGHSDE